MELERKYCGAGEALRVIEDEQGTGVAGYASLFGVADQGRDVVAAGAYAATLAALSARGGRVKMLWQHDPAQPIGVWDEVREDARGLWVKGRILTQIKRGREAAALIAAGALDGLSIGYRAKRASRDAQGRRVLHELELWEVSLVTFPMLPEARIGASAGAKGADPLRGMAALLRQAGRDLAGG
ncbi:phage prohead protease, HK97 family [Oceaniovalibus guishaninsula JLT2003]|uniref:Phage prohead protease, HK97 family n=1 Tax=Oceaniovalibus guishaninsula JLT2003 TaxID=1231392 RepID=K2HLC0_9RHOB|nr:HK97 family phage prohead protease [Oceaniovalibus guishaninsula]EKE43654.1 phage prohead protease, HK97 family [Oceaniovalibus guishaninsula JLT2003]